MLGQMTLASLFGGAGGAFANGVGNNLFDGGLFGTVNRGSSNGSSSSRFDTSQLPLFYQELAKSQQAGTGLQELFRQLGGQRTAALQSNLDQQLAAVQGYGNQEQSDINQRYNSRQGNVGQSLTNRGLYNTTVAPGMNALVERERNNALGQATDRQRGYLGGILGQRAQLLDNSVAQQNNAIGQVGMQNYGLQSLLPQNIASSRVSNTTQQNKEKKGGWLSGLFG